MIATIGLSASARHVAYDTDIMAKTPRDRTLAGNPAQPEYKSLIFAAIGLFLSAVGVFVGVRDVISTNKHPPPPSYELQIKSLDQTRDSVEQLLKFIETQREQLTASQRAIDALKTEEDRLKPLVEADKKVIDAVFAAQEARNEQAQRRQTWLGFVLGVLSSLMASFVWSIGYTLYKRRKAAGTPAAP